jgi:hypothetical protein
VQALPHADTVREMFPSGPPASLADPAWAARKMQARKLRHYAGPLPERDLGATIVATQRTQAAALQTGIEACRLRREGSGQPHPCGGVAFWQYNEPWRAVSWSIVDRAGRPKAAYEMLARSYQPLLVAARFERRTWQPGERFKVEIWIVNDTPQSYDGCRVEARIDGQMVYRRDGIAAPSGSARRVGRAELVLQASPSLLQMTCVRHGSVIADNVYDLGVYPPPRQPVVAWLIRRAADLLLRTD